MKRLLFAALIACLSATQALAILPGLMQGVPDQGLTAVTFVASNTDTADNTVDLPTGLADGDFGILVDHALNGTTTVPTNVVPAGWTQIATFTGIGGSGGNDRGRTTISYKLLTAAESGSTLTGMNGSDQEEKVVLVFRGNKPITSVTPSTWQGEITNGNPSAQSPNPTGETPPVIVFASPRADGSAALSVESPAFAARVATGDNNTFVGYTIYNVGDTPASHSVDQADQGNHQHFVSGYVVLQ